MPPGGFANTRAATIPSPDRRLLVRTGTARFGLIPLCLALGGYLAFVAVSLAALLALGARAALVLPGLAALLFFALDLFRATVLVFAALPHFLEVGLPAYIHAFWYVTLVPLILAWGKQLLLAPQRVHLPPHYLALYLAFVGAILLSVQAGVDWRLYLPESFAPKVIWWALDPILASVVSIPVISVVSDRRQLRRLAWGIVIGGLLHTIPIFFFTVRGPKVLDFARYYGLLGGPHVAGLFEVFYFFVAATLFWTERNRRLGRLGLACAATFLIALFLSGSRTAIFSFAVLAGIVIVRDAGRLWRRTRVIHVWVAVILLVGATVLVGNVVKITPGGVYGASALDRMILVQYGFTLFQQSPLTGVGIGRHVPVIQDWPLAPQHHINVIHTYYVTVLAETGLVGFIPFMLIIGVTVFHYVRALRRFAQQGDAEMYWLGSAFLFGLIGVLIMWMTQAATGERLFWALVGLAFVVRRIARDPHAAPAPA